MLGLIHILLFFISKEDNKCQIPRETTESI